MPLAVLVAASVDYLIAALFVVVPVIAYRYGTAAQRAAEAEVTRQGYPPDTLARHRVTFAESAAATLFPFAIALVLAALATLLLAGSGTARVVTWVAQPILLVAGGLTTAGQVFPAPYVRAALRRSGEATRGVDVTALLAAARREFPTALRPIVAVRFALVTVGSLLVVVLLALPSAGVHFA